MRTLLIYLSISFSVCVCVCVCVCERERCTLKLANFEQTYMLAGRSRNRKHLCHRLQLPITLIYNIHYGLIRFHCPRANAHTHTRYYQ